jgi:hypothetical protein
MEAEVVLTVKKSSIRITFPNGTIKLGLVAPGYFSSLWWRKNELNVSSLKCLGRVNPHSFALASAVDHYTIWTQDGLEKISNVGGIRNLCLDVESSPRTDSDVRKTRYQISATSFDYLYPQLLNEGFLHDQLPQLPSIHDRYRKKEVHNHLIHVGDPMPFFMKQGLSLLQMWPLSDVPPVPYRSPNFISTTALPETLRLLLPRAVRFIEVVDGVLTIDLSYQQLLPVRDGFERYGVKMELHPDFSLKTVKLFVDGDWLPHPIGDHRALRIASASLCLHLVTYGHTFQLHLGSVQRLISLCQILTGEKRQLLQLFTTDGAFLSGRVMEVLTPKRGVFERIFALTSEGIKQIYYKGLGQKLWPSGDKYFQVMEHLKNLDKHSTHPIVKTYILYFERVYDFLVTYLGRDLASAVVTDVVGVTLSHSIEGEDVSTAPLRIWRGGGGYVGGYTSELEEYYKKKSDNLIFYNTFTLADDYSDYFAKFPELYRDFKDTFQSPEMNDILSKISLKIESVNISTDM